MADEIVLNATQIARLAGVARGTAAAWCRHGDDFPAPAGSAPGGPVYDRAEVEAWLAAAGRWELDPGPRVWREVSRAARDGSLREAVAGAAAAAARHGNGEVPPPGVPGALARLAARAVDEVGAAAVLGGLLERYAAASGIPVTPARIAAFMISLAGIGDGATVLDPAAGTGELLAAALARGAGRVLAQDPDAATAGLARSRLFPGQGQRAAVAAGDALGADAFAGLEADAVVCRPPGGPETAAAWAWYALAHLKPGGRAVLALPPSAAAAPSGRPDREQMLRRGVLRTVIALPAAVAPPYVPLHLWVLRRPDGDPGPDLLALFADACQESRTGADYAACAAAGTMPAASWQAFTRTVELAGDSPRHPGTRVVSSGGGRNARWCVTRVADLLDDAGVLGASERLDETVDLTPARVRAHFSAWHREKDKERSLRRGGAAPVNPPATFTHSRLARFLIARDIDAAAALLRRLDWLGDLAAGPDAEPSQPWLPAGPWRTATVPELARLGQLRYRPAGTSAAELLRAGDVLVPAAVTAGTVATVAGEDRDGDPAGPGVHLIRPDPAHLNSWFLAGFLSPGTRQGTGNRVDVRSLEAPLLPLADQERYARVFRDARSLEVITGRLEDRARSLAGDLAAGLAGGDFRPGPGTSSAGGQQP
jgi:precorrin-6B methylase 2